MRDLSAPRRTSWDRETIVYLSGLLEGEGSFVVRRSGAEIMCGMTDEDVLVRAHKIAGVGSLNGPYRGTKGCKPFWTWSICRRREVEALAAALHPHMGTRRRSQIDALLHHLHNTEPAAPKCGTFRMYRRGCRCRPCKDANAKHYREYRARRAA